MSVKYVDEATGDFLPGALEKTGAPTRYGIKTMEELVAPSLLTNNVNKDVFYKQY